MSEGAGCLLFLASVIAGIAVATIYSAAYGWLAFAIGLALMGILAAFLEKEED